MLLLATACSAELSSGNEAAICTVLAFGRSTVVDFGARSRIPCKKMAPILEQLEKEFQGNAA